MLQDVPTVARAKGRGVWRWLVAIALAALLLYRALHGVDWARVWQTVAAARWSYLVGGAAVGVVSYALRALRWRILLNASGCSLGLGTVFRANMAGYLGNNVLPARAGELIRSLMISSQSRLSSAYVLTTALAERLVDAIALVLYGSLTLSLVPAKPAWMDGVAHTMAIAAGAGAVALIVLPHAEGLALRMVQWLALPAGVKHRMAHLVEQILLALRAFQEVRRFLYFAALTAAVWLTDAASAMVSARGLRLEVTLPMAILLMTAMGLGSALPSTPGYIGIYQFAAVTVLGSFGIGRDPALAFSLVTQAFGYVVVALLGIPGLYGGWLKAKTVPAEIGVDSWKREPGSEKPFL